MTPLDRLAAAAVAYAEAYAAHYTGPITKAKYLAWCDTCEELLFAARAYADHKGQET